MWQGLYPGKAEEEVPIGHITNGIHARTWMATDMYTLLLQHLGPRWLDRISHADLWTAIDKVRDAEIWEVHQGLRARLLPSARRRLAERRERLSLIRPEREPLDPEALTL